MAAFFGKQTFLNTDHTGKSSEVTSFYKFADKASFESWQKSDLTVYQADVDKKFTRTKATQKQFDDAVKNDGKFKDYSGENGFRVQSVDEKGSYVHLKSPNEKYANDFGLVIKFQNPDTKKAFMKEHGDFYKANMKDLTTKDPRVIAANTNNLFLYISEKQKNPTMLINTALKNYPQLNPARKHLVYISQKDFKKPEIYSFGSKNERRKFLDHVKKGIKNKNLPIHVSIGKNFSPIVIDHAAKGKILEGSLSKHFDHMREYLQFHNGKDITPSKEKLDTKGLIDTIEKMRNDPAVERPLIENKDLRAVDFSKVDLKGVDLAYNNLSGQNLAGIDLSGSHLKKNNFSGSDLSAAKFEGAVLEGNNFKNITSLRAHVSFKGTKDMGSDFKYSSMFDASFQDAQFSRTNFYSSHLIRADFIGASMKGVDFNKSDLNCAKFDHNLDKIETSQFKGSNLNRTSIEGTHLDKGQKAAAQAMG